jgi:hypothetical protein
VPVEPIPQHVLDAAQAEAFREAVHNEPPAANVAAATTLHDPGAVTFRRWTFQVPPIPFRQALWLEALGQDLSRLVVVMAEVADSTLVRRAILVTLERMADVMWAMVRRPWWWRFVYRPSFNPFRDGEQAELEALTRFFSGARTRCRVGTRLSVRAPRWCQPTTPASLPPSRGIIRRGFPPLATLAVTDISDSPWPPSTWSAYQARASVSP